MILPGKRNHSEFELNYVVRGRGEFTCGGERFTFEPSAG